MIGHMNKFGGMTFALSALMALAGCSESAPVAEPTPLVIEQAAAQVKTIRQGDYLTEVKKLLSSEDRLNDIQLLAAGYEACLTVNEGNKDEYREKILANAKNLEAGLDQLVIAAGAKSLLCP